MQFDDAVESRSGETRYGVAVDVKRAADLHAQGRTLCLIGAELGFTATTVTCGFVAPGSSCVAAVPLIPPSQSRSWSCATKA
jgi:hypothetical protein